MVMRISGLASGMDIDSIVENLMQAERVPLDKLEQKKQSMEWQRDDFREISTMMFNLDKMLFDVVMKQSTYIKKSVNISDSNMISINNKNSTVDFAGSIKVKSLATASRVVSGSTGVTDSSKTLDQLFPGMSGTQKIKVQAINSKGELEEKELEFDPSTATLNDVISQVNQKTGVSMFFDSQTGKLSATSKNTGAESITLTDVSGDLFSNLKLTGSEAISTKGTNALIEYNGIETTRTSNTFTINGFEITLKQADPNKEVTFNSKPDVDAIADTIVKFVDEYNKLVEKLNTKLTEKKYRDYQPLTSEQRKAMEEKDIELWEEKAKSGTLRGDSVLSSSLTKMRTNLYSPVSGLSGINQLAEIGITTTKNYLDGGKLEIDMDKLKEAISKDPNGVYTLFAQKGDTTEEKGLGQRLRDSLKSTMESIEKKAGKATSVNNTFTIGRLLNNVNDQMDSLKSKLVDIESRYYRQFTAMEQAIQKANSQSAYLMQFFS